MSEFSTGLTLDALNGLPDQRFTEHMAACCGSERWQRKMSARRPFADVDALLTAAEQAAERLTEQDWLQAFSHHPRIGDVDALRRRFGSRSGSWSQAEQTGVEGTEESILERLAEGNLRYEQRFGYIFIVCASGKSASEMLQILESRLGNDRDEELIVAAGQQRNITRLRLLKLLGV